MKTSKLVILFLATVAFCGCTTPPVSDKISEGEGTGKYFIQSCHFGIKDLTCSKKPYGACTFDLEPSDFCGRFVSCTNSGKVKKEKEYNKCVDCFGNVFGDQAVSKECLQAFPDYNRSL